MDASNLARLRRMAPDREAAQRTALFLSFDPARSGTDGDLEVPDPWGGGPEEYALVLCRRLVGGIAVDLPAIVGGNRNICPDSGIARASLMTFGEKICTQFSATFWPRITLTMPL